MAVNPESQHLLGREARRTLEAAREQLGTLLGLHQADIHADHLFFTSGGTEANNLALQGYQQDAEQKRRLVISGIEHPSISTTAAWLTSWVLTYKPSTLSLMAKLIVTT